MNINTFLQGKLFKKTCKEYEKLTSPIRQDGSYSLFDCLIDGDKTWNVINQQANLQKIVDHVNESEIKEFIVNKDVQEGFNILQGIAIR